MTIATEPGPNARPFPGSLGIELSYDTRRADKPLWLPPRMRRAHREKLSIIVPEGTGLRKAVYFKGRLYVKDRSLAPSNIDYRWVSDWLRCPYGLDIDEPGVDGLSVRDQIHIWITGKLERVSGGTWVYQNSDERWSTTVIEELPLNAHSRERYQRFYFREE